MIKLLLLLPMLLLVITQVIAAIGMPGEAKSHAVSLSQYALPLAMYVTASVTGATCLVLALRARAADGAWTAAPVLVGLSLVTAVVVVVGPLLWGQAIGEFHLSHHLVRAVLLLGVLVLYWWHVAIYR